MRAAIGVIAEKGTAALRMADIAARAGMSTGHILYHFGRRTGSCSKSSRGARRTSGPGSRAPPTKPRPLTRSWTCSSASTSPPPGRRTLRAVDAGTGPASRRSRSAGPHRAAGRLGRTPGGHRPRGPGRGELHRRGPPRLHRPGRGHAERALRGRDVRAVPLAARLRARVRPVRPPARAASHRPGVTRTRRTGSRPAASTPTRPGAGLPARTWWVSGPWRSPNWSRAPGATAATTAGQDSTAGRRGSFVSVRGVGRRTRRAPRIVLRRPPCAGARPGRRRRRASPPGRRAGASSTRPGRPLPSRGRDGGGR